jgi:hypothetical protein
VHRCFCFTCSEAESRAGLLKDVLIELSHLSDGGKVVTF